jgi:hypothetical protein
MDPDAYIPRHDPVQHADDDTGPSAASDHGEPPQIEGLAPHI